MASSTDFKKLHDLYQLEGVPRGLSIVRFCQMKGIVYKHYEHWYKNYHSAKIIPVELVDSDNLSDSLASAPAPCSDPVAPSCIRSFDLYFSDGLHIHHDQIDYRSLRTLIEKLEVLC